MTLTPFERAAVGQKRTALISAAISASREMVDLGHQCDIQIAAYRNLLLLGEAGKAQRAEEKGITVEAMKDSRMANQAIVAMADTLERTFGINA
jgi:hypothetical protein